jgi:hypothetical protein
MYEPMVPSDSDTMCEEYDNPNTEEAGSYRFMQEFEGAAGQLEKVDRLLLAVHPRKTVARDLWYLREMTTSYVSVEGELCQLGA